MRKLSNFAVIKKTNYKMKRFLISLLLNLCLASVAMTAWSQNLMLSQEESEDEIAVVGYFCKNDTMTYRQTHNK